MTRSTRSAIAVTAAAVLCVLATALASGQTARPGNANPDGPALVPNNAMANPYRMLPNWPHLGDIKPGAAIGILPDGKGGVWLQHRSVPAIVHINAAGDVVQRFSGPDGKPLEFASSHGLCRDRDGNFWALDSGTFYDGPTTGIKGNQVFKFSPDGKLLLTLGKAGVSKAGEDTFIQPTACLETPDGNILIADGHWPRPSVGQQDGDRLVWFTRDGKFLKAYGKHGRLPGEFMGPHGIAFDSKGRLFIADRSNNRVLIFNNDKDMQVVDAWTQFGRPSGIWILKDDTLIVSDSESNHTIGGPMDTPEGGPNAIRNPGWKNGIRIGSAKDGSLKYFIPGTRPEGMAADELGNIYGGLTGGCDASPSGGCLQKFVKK